MRPLEEIRVDIDRIDAQMRELIMERLDLSEQVIAAKIESRNYIIYREDREIAMMERLGKEVPENRRAEYLSILKRVIETSKMYQYGILFDKAGDLYEKLVSGIEIPEHSERVTVKLTRPDVPNAMSSVLNIIGDYGYNMDQMRILDYSEDRKHVIFELKILGDLCEVNMKKMLLQLSMETKDFSVVEVK